MLGLGAGYGRHRFGSMSAALAYLRGERLLVDESSKTIDDVRSGSEIVVRYGFTNWAAHPVKLLGMSSSCSCTVVEDLPMTLAASETKAVSVKIKVDEGRPDFTGSIRVFTDDPRSPEIILSYSLRITPPSAGVRSDP